MKKSRANEDLAYRLRKSMEELGGGFIKLGQLLSLRPDLIPVEFCDEFKKLLDDVPPEKFDVIKKQIGKSLDKKDLKKVFRHIDSKPIGSGSVAQVHKAELINGKEVAVKVLRPGIKDIFLTDINVLRYLAGIAEKRFKNLPIIPSKIVDEFERYTNNELNLVFEARNIERFGKQKHSAKIVIPKVYWPSTSKNMITMDYLPGKKLSHVKHPDKKSAEIILNELVKEVFEYGFFHADLHPGNVIVMKNSRIGLLDFGIVGFVDKDLRMLGLLLYKAISKRDVDLALRALLKYGSISKQSNIIKLKRDIYEILNEWYAGEGKESKPTHALRQLFVSCAKNGVVVPENAVLFAKALITAEGTCHYINPDFNFNVYAVQKAAKVLSKYRSSKVIKKYILEEAKKSIDIAKQIPEQSLNVLQKLSSGRLDFSLDDSHFRRIGFNISDSSNRVAYALIITALIIAAAMLIDFGPFIYGYPALSIAALILAGVLMIPLFFSIIHEPKRPV